MMAISYRYLSRKNPSYAFKLCAKAIEFEVSLDPNSQSQNSSAQLSPLNVFAETGSNACRKSTRDRLPTCRRTVRRPRERRISLAREPHCPACTQSQKTLYSPVCFFYLCVFVYRRQRARLRSFRHSRHRVGSRDFSPYFPPV